MSLSNALWNITYDTIRGKKNKGAKCTECPRDAWYAKTEADKKKRMNRRRKKNENQKTHKGKRYRENRRQINKRRPKSDKGKERT